MKRLKDITLNLLILLTFLVFVYSGFQVYKYYYDAAKEDEEYKVLQENFGTVIDEVVETPKIKETTENINQEEEPEIKEPTLSLTYKWDDLMSVNSHIQGWLYIPDSYIDYPVVKGTNNSYYLNHSFDKNWNSNGCLFVDYRSDYENDEVLIIHGHNMIGNSTELLRTVMFSSLILWLDEDYLNSHSSVYYTRPETITEEYKIYAIDLLAVYDKDKTFDYLERNLDTEEEFNEYVSSITKYAVLKNDENVPKYGDKIMVLSTCYRPFDKSGKNGGRLLIFATKHMEDR